MPSEGRSSTEPTPVPDEVALPPEEMSDEGSLDIPEEAMCCEISFDVFQTDVVPDEGFLWTVGTETACGGTAMRKEWQSWLENKVTTIAKSRGIDLLGPDMEEVLRP